ncbi:MAG TPA: hypothetical protein VIK86_05780 [Candidatus Paceibacterota bacterium]
MDEKFKKYKENFIKNNFFEKGSRVKLEEYEKSDDKEMYVYENIGNGDTYYRKDVLQLSDEELDLGIKIGNFKRYKKINNNIDTMKKIMIFWLVLTIINLIAVFYMVSKIANITNITQ